MSEQDDAVLAEYAAKISRAEGIVGYSFKDKLLLGAALTHPSAVDRQNIVSDYERLEFLGDSILGAITASYLFTHFGDLEEGGLTRIKVALVSGSSLSRIASAEGIADCIVFGESETGTDRRGLNSALENVFEAIVAALYLDGGIEVARAWVTRSVLKHADRNLASEPESPKSSLQEMLQDQGKQPRYEITGHDGPPHQRTFFARVLVGDEVMGEGSGHSKKKAEAEAAKAALDLIAQRELEEASRPSFNVTSGALNYTVGE